MERLTGGAVRAGMHEVVVLPDTVAAAARREAEGRPAWRVSSRLSTRARFRVSRGE